MYCTLHLPIQWHTCNYRSSLGGMYHGACTDCKTGSCCRKSWPCKCYIAVRSSPLHMCSFHQARQSTCRAACTDRTTCMTDHRRWAHIGCRSIQQSRHYTRSSHRCQACRILEHYRVNTRYTHFQNSCRRSRCTAPRSIPWSMCKSHLQPSCQHKLRGHCIGKARKLARKNHSHRYRTRVPVP